MSATWEELNALFETTADEGSEIGVEIKVGTLYAFSCELRYTPKPNDEPGYPDYSHTFFAVGGGTPEEVLQKCLDALSEFQFQEQEKQEEPA